jgi:flagellin-like hook-associated protein FlgL
MSAEWEIVAIEGYSRSALGLSPVSEDKGLAGLVPEEETGRKESKVEEIAVVSQFASAVNPNAPMQQNYLNAISYLQAKDASLAKAGEVFARMNELKALSDDPSNSATDMERFNAEFGVLKEELRVTLEGTFNGKKVFSDKELSGFGKALDGTGREPRELFEEGQKKYTASIIISGAGEGDRISASINGLAVDAVDFQGSDSETALELAEEINQSGCGVTATAGAGVVKIEGEERFTLEAKATDSDGGQTEGIVRTLLEGFGKAMGNLEKEDGQGFEDTGKGTSALGGVGAGMPGLLYAPWLQAAYRGAGTAAMAGAHGSFPPGYSRAVEWAS